MARQERQKLGLPAAGDKQKKKGSAGDDPAEEKTETPPPAGDGERCWREGLVLIVGVMGWCDRLVLFIPPAEGRASRLRRGNI